MATITDLTDGIEIVDSHGDTYFIKYGNCKLIKTDVLKIYDNSENRRGQANNSLSFRFNKWDDSASAFVPLDYTIQTRTVNSLVGGRDVAIFNVDVGGVLDQNDFLKLQIRNNSGNSNVTLENSSFYRVQER